MGKSIIQILLVLLILCNYASAQYSGGTGEPNTPYQIEDVNDILELANEPNDYDKCFVLTNDVNMEGMVFERAIIAFDKDNSKPAFQGRSFSGVFDGNNHVITNFDINSTEDYIGLFGAISSGEVKNLGLVNVEITTTGMNWFIGILAGYCGNYSTVKNCYSIGNMSMGELSYYLGGLLGVNCVQSIVTNCYSICNIEGERHNWYLGGLVGKNLDTSIIANCYSTSDINMDSNSFSLGGLVGSNNAIITNCYSSGNVYGGNGCGWVGGFIGNNHDGTVINCYSSGKVQGATETGGFIGLNEQGTIISSFWDIKKSGLKKGIGDTLHDPKGVMGLNTKHMKKISTFINAGWDFVNETPNGTEDIWTIKEGVKYPELVWPLVQFYSWDGVDLKDYALFANNWLMTNCDDINDCDSADLDFSGTVDGSDLDIFITYWLSGK